MTAPNLSKAKGQLFAIASYLDDLPMAYALFDAIVDIFGEKTLGSADAIYQEYVEWLLDHTPGIVRVEGCAVFQRVVSQ